MLRRLIKQIPLAVPVYRSAACGVQKLSEFVKYGQVGATLGRTKSAHQRGPVVLTGENHSGWAGTATAPRFLQTDASARKAGRRWHTGHNRTCAGGYTGDRLRFSGKAEPWLSV